MAHSSFARLLCQGAVLFVAFVAAEAPALAERNSQAAGPFAALVGSWSGSGTVSLANGSNERIRCQAAYATGNDLNNLRSVLRCASDSYKFELNSDVRDEGGKITGAWREATRNVTGPIAGTASGGDLQANIDMPGFAAGLNIATRGDKQVVSLRSQGTELTGISITFSRK